MKFVECQRCHVVEYVSDDAAKEETMKEWAPCYYCGATTWKVYNSLTEIKNYVEIDPAGTTDFDLKAKPTDD